MPHVLLLTGTCGSGKSTVAGLLESRGWFRISEDAIWPRYFGRDRGPFGSDEHRRKREFVHEIVFAETRGALDAGRKVVIDATVHEAPPEAFEEYRAFFTGARIAWYVRVLHPSLEVAVMRDRMRAQGSLGFAQVATLHAKFTGLVFPADAFIDTSVQTPAETVDALLRSVDQAMTLIPSRLRAGDRVRVVSPASSPDREDVARGVRMLESWGLVVEMGDHVFDRRGHFLAGADADRLADINDAFRDPGVRAILSTCGGKGSYRIAHGLDFAAAHGNPKPLVGYSDVTMLHLALWERCRLAGLHGPHVGWRADYYGQRAADQLRQALMEPAPITLRADPKEATAEVIVEGKARGILMGGNLVTIGRAVGWMCPRFAGAILLIEAVDTFIGQIDATLTQLRRSGLLEGLVGVAVGQFIRSAEPKPGKWSVVDVLLDQLGELGVPVLGGLPIGHGPHPPTVPVGTLATIDTRTKTLTVEPAVV